ncbi:MAG: hypothetical protein V1907_04705 [Candidatus Kerfeldbacteria bacterium]
MSNKCDNSPSLFRYCTRPILWPTSETRQPSPEDKTARWLNGSSESIIAMSRWGALNGTAEEIAGYLRLGRTTGYSSILQGVA